jgi:hypothetical protein
MLLTSPGRLARAGRDLRYRAMKEKRKPQMIKIAAASQPERRNAPPRQLAPPIERKWRLAWLGTRSA